MTTKPTPHGAALAAHAAAVAKTADMRRLLTEAQDDADLRTSSRGRIARPTPIVSTPSRPSSY